MTVAQLIEVLQRVEHQDKQVLHCGSEWELDIATAVETTAHVYLSSNPARDALKYEFANGSRGGASYVRVLQTIEPT